jgi:aspartate racemase
MPRETATFCRACGFGRVGVLATEGTVRSGIYRDALNAEGIEYLTCSEEDQVFISDTIYACLKQGKCVDKERFIAIARSLIEAGCEAVILGCTELSCLKKEVSSDICFVDPMEILAAYAIAECGAEPIGFDDALMDILKTKGR